MDNLARVEDDDDVVVPFKLAAQGPPSWLTGLPIGTIFLAKRRIGAPTIAFSEFTVLGRSRLGNVLLSENIRIGIEDKSQYIHVDPNTFSDIFYLVEILREE